MNSNTKNLKVLLLAAGDSTRFWPFEEKHLVSFLGKPQILFCLEQLKRFGYQDFIIAANKDNISELQKISKFIPTAKFDIFEQKDKRGMAGAVYDAKEFIGNSPLLIVGPSDVFEDILIHDFEKLLQSNPEAILSGIQMNEYFPGGYLTIKDSKIISIVEKPGPQKAPSNIVNFVFDYFLNPRKLIDAIEKQSSDKDDIYETALQYLIGKGVEFIYLPYKGYWGYLKYPWNCLSLMEYYLSKIKTKNKVNVQIDPTASIDGEVFLGEGVKIMGNARIVGPTYIGDGTIIGNNSMVRESMIGNNCVVGFSSEITRSFIGDNCWFHNNYLGDSVIANDVSFGAGTVTGNFRLDEGNIKSFVGNESIQTGKTKLGAIIGSHVRVGINASIMPGVKIGKNTFVGPAVLVDKDIAQDKYCFNKSDLIIKDQKKNTVVRKKASFNLK